MKFPKGTEWLLTQLRTARRLRGRLQQGEPIDRKKPTIYSRNFYSRSLERLGVTGPN